MDDLTNDLIKNKEDLKCGICAKYLSISPISHVSSMGYVCGRCQNKISQGDSGKPVTFERQSLYELIAKYMPFPCSYKSIGCHAELTWDEVFKHENMCPFRNTVCPISDRNKTFLSSDQVCSWRGNNQQLNPHLFSSHKIYFINPPQVFLSPKFKTTFFFTEVMQQVMMVILKYYEDINKFFIYVLANLSDIECNFFRYQVEVFDEAQAVSVILRRNKVEPMCDSIFKTNTLDGLEMDIKKLSGMLKNTPAFFAKVSIARKSKKDIKVLKSNLPPNSVLITAPKELSLAIDEGILQELECPVCNDYMVPPIYICQAGHSVCNSCNTKINTCPTCRSTMLDTRNFTLEKLTNLVNYPCKNRSTGCFFITSADKIRNHEKNCSLTGKSCILKCQWRGNTLDMIIHLTEKHTVLQLDDVQTIFLGPQKKISNEAIIYDNQVFLFTFSYGFKIPFYYNLQHLGFDNTKYKYAIEILDRSGNNLNLSLRHMCSPFVLSVDKNKGKKDECKSGFSLPYDLIQQLVFDNKEFDYKIKISKVNSK